MHVCSRECAHILSVADFMWQVNILLSHEPVWPTIILFCAFFKVCGIEQVCVNVVKRCLSSACVDNSTRGMSKCELRQFRANHAMRHDSLVPGIDCLVGQVVKVSAPKAKGLEFKSRL